MILIFFIHTYNLGIINPILYGWDNGIMGWWSWPALAEVRIRNQVFWPQTQHPFLGTVVLKLKCASDLAGGCATQMAEVSDSGTGPENLHL
jgi:hypothetical protein